VFADSTGFMGFDGVYRKTAPKQPSRFSDPLTAFDIHVWRVIKRPLVFVIQFIILYKPGFRGMDDKTNEKEP
jgi:hypothetical protein